MVRRTIYTAKFSGLAPSSYGTDEFVAARLIILWKFELIMALPRVPGRLLQDPTTCNCEAGKR